MRAVKPGVGEFITFWVTGPDDAARMVAGMNVDVWDVNDRIEAFVASGRAVDVSCLGNPELDLGDL